MKLSRNSRISQGAVLAVVLMAGGASPALADFAYSDFTSVAGLSFNGAAVHSSPAISITPPIRSAAGSVWHNTPQVVDTGFISNFTFRISDVAGRGSDGFAFVIQNDAAGTSAIGGTGGAMGYATNTVFPSQVGIANGLAVEFDTWDNTGDWQDFNSAQHVSVQSMGPLSMVPSGMSSIAHGIAASDFADNAVHTVRLVYVPGTLDVYLDNLATPLFSASVNLSTLLNLNGGNSAYVGFTAGTGAIQDVERHGILSWDFTTTEIPTPGAASLLAAGGLVLGRRRRSHA